MFKRTSFFHYLLFATLFAAGIISCGDANGSNSDDSEEKDPLILELQALEKAVIDVHDEVMPKMSTLNNTRGKLVKQNKNESLTSEEHTALTEAVIHLEEADSLMWNWMHNYSRPDYNGDLDSAKAYLENEKVTVLHMRDKFLSSMAEGEALLTKNNGDEN